MLQYNRKCMNEGILPNSLCSEAREINSMDSLKKLECMVCDTRFICLQNLIDHQMQHHKEVMLTIIDKNKGDVYQNMRVWKITNIEDIFQDKLHDRRNKKIKKRRYGIVRLNHDN